MKDTAERTANTRAEIQIKSLRSQGTKANNKSKRQKTISALFHKCVGIAV